MTAITVSAGEIKAFAHDFSASVDQGVSLTRSLAAIAARQTNPELRRVIEQINADLQNGSRLSTAMASHPALFDPATVTVVAQGEVSGHLDDALRILA